MPKYIIEGEIPGAGHLTDKQLEAITQISGDISTKLVHKYIGNTVI